MKVKRVVVVATYPGSGIGELRKIFSMLHASLVPVASAKAIERTPYDAVLLAGGQDIHPSLYGQQVTFSEPWCYYDSWTWRGWSQKPKDVGIQLALPGARGNALPDIVRGEALEEEDLDDYLAGYYFGGGGYNNIRAVPIADKPSHRDLIEKELTLRALDRNIPILGLCRGHQMLAAVAGGTLYQDIELETGIKHGYGLWHRLGAMTKTFNSHVGGWLVNSFHHQAVKDMPPDFHVVAETDDGIIEAIWKPGALGVQFHPEWLVGSKRRDRKWMRLFKWFVKGRLR